MSKNAIKIFFCFHIGILILNIGMEGVARFAGLGLQNG